MEGKCKSGRESVRTKIMMRESGSRLDVTDHVLLKGMESLY